MEAAACGKLVLEIATWLWGLKGDPHGFNNIYIYFRTPFSAAARYRPHLRASTIPFISP